MLLEWIAELVKMHGAVTSALVLALTTYLIKFISFRAVSPIDYIVAVTEIPATGSATCCSLLIASLYLPQSNGRVISIYIMITLIVFLINIGVYRYIESRKLALSSIWGRVLFLLFASYLTTFFIGISAALDAYEGAKL